MAVSCQSTTIREIALFNNRPHNEARPCISNGDGTCWENGELKDTINMQCQDAITMDDMLKHLEAMEYFRWKCQKFGRCK